jgi:hypothetical protein
LIHINVLSTIVNEMKETRLMERSSGGVSVSRYFFTIRGRDRIKDDRAGTNLPDLAAALSNAERKIGELRKESGYDDPTLMMIVKDEAGQTVLSLPFFPGY